MRRVRKASARGRYIEHLKTQKYEAFQLQNSGNTSMANYEKTERISLLTLLKKVWLVLTDKANTNGNMTSVAFAAITSIVFKLIACFGFLIVVAGIWVLCTQARDMAWTGIDLIFKHIYSVVLMSMLLIVVFLYSVIMWGSSNEMKRERDKNYIVSVFSGVVSFAALIVALVALVMG